MTTERKIAANRANAQKSTGPKTTAGKARSAQNRLRHGLWSRSFLRHVPTRGQVEEIASSISNGALHGPLYDQALIVAECSAHIEGIRTMRIALIEQYR